jgi:hypothetical protein
MWPILVGMSKSLSGTQTSIHQLSTRNVNGRDRGAVQPTLNTKHRQFINSIFPL